MDYEVIVVGAGPGGSVTAALLAQQGHNVLLLDRHTFPRDKTCGDGIPAGAVDILYELGLKDQLEEIDHYETTKIRLVSPGGCVFDGDLGTSQHGVYARVVPRMVFDALLQEKAVTSGAVFQQAQVKAPIFKDGQVKGVRAVTNGRTQDLFAPIVVGADGVTSVIAPVTAAR